TARAAAAISPLSLHDALPISIQGYRVVRSFGGEDYESRRFLEASANNAERQLRMTRTSAIYTPTLQLVTYSAMAAVLFLVLLLRSEEHTSELQSREKLVCRLL